MSRIGKKPITVPKGIDVKIDSNQISVKGPKGSLVGKLHDSVQVKVDSGIITVSPKVDSKENKRYHGLSRTLIANMVEGCDKGYQKSLTLVGVGYRAAQQGPGLNLTLGFSHPVYFEPLPGVTLAVDKLTTIHVSGASKEAVGETAAKIRSLRPPEPYHGKGIRYSDEKIATKVGKASGKK